MNKLDSKFGDFGGMYVPELLIPALDQLEQAFIDAQNDPEFQKEFMDLLQKDTCLTGFKNIQNSS